MTTAAAAAGVVTLEGLWPAVLLHTSIVVAGIREAYLARPESAIVFALVTAGLLVASVSGRYDLASIIVSALVVYTLTTTAIIADLVRRWRKGDKNV